MERLKGEGVHDWLSQHLTTSWHGHQTVASELGNDIIANIKERWSQLESSVRLGVLFSLISLKKAQQLELKDKCQELIDHACSDPDDWVRLVSQMLKQFPKDATLRFNVEQFSDQAQLGSLLDELTTHISRDGIKFHPKEFAYLSESVCRSGQGKDSAAKTYPPLTGPSLQQHFNLKDSHVDIHTERAEKLKKMAAQASPIVASGSFPTVGAGASGVTTGNTSLGSTPASSTNVGSVGSTTAAAAAAPLGSGTSTPSSGPLGPPGQPPRPPTKSSSTGLFVRKPAGSFLRNNAPRPMALSRNPSAGQLPLRSPRLDSPTTPRLNQKSSRIQILDIQQGNEIMQNMNDEKRRKEQAEQREKELKKEQRQQEMELKRQQDAEKKAQLQKEKEEKKREREEAKKNKERQKQDRDRQKQEKDNEQDHESPQIGETRRQPDDDDDDEGEEGSLSSLPAKKKLRPTKSSSRRSSRDDDADNDYDNADRPEPISPTTPSNSYPYSNQEDGQPTPAISHSEGNGHSDSYFPHQQQLQQQLQHQLPQSTSSVVNDNPTIFQDTNMLTPEDRAYIEAFLEGHPMKRPHENESLYQIVMNQNQVQDAAGRIMYETILIEMNFDSGEWKKIKRRRARPHVPVSTAQ